MSNPKFTNCRVADVEYARSSGAILVDVREFAEFATARLPGSQLIPLAQIAERSVELDRNRPVMVVCRTGRRSSEAAAILCRLGFEDVRNLEGGIEACRAEGIELERDVKAPWAIERQVRLLAGALVIFFVVLSVVVAQPFVWLAALVGAGMMFASITDSCAMGLVMARMPWNANSNTTCEVERIPMSR